MAIVSMKALLEAGVHFGHRTRRWHPKMKPYIFTERNGIHIIDLSQTINRIGDAYNLTRDIVKEGGTVLFVGTKKQAQDSIVEEANRCAMPYVTYRWLGGTLTNWRTMRQRIDYMIDLEKKKSRGEFTRLTKKEALLLEREIERLSRRFGGLREMHRLPNALYIVDVHREEIAIKEANLLGIPTIAMVDTNCDPDPIDYVIPSNDDAIRAIKLMASIMADAAVEGRGIYDTIKAEEEETAATGVEDQERYLGPSTLAKLRASRTPDEVVTDEVRSDEYVSEMVDELEEIDEEGEDYEEANGEELVVDDVEEET